MRNFSALFREIAGTCSKKNPGCDPHQIFGTLERLKQCATSVAIAVFLASAACKFYKKALRKLLSVMLKIFTNALTLLSIGHLSNLSATTTAN